MAFASSLVSALVVRGCGRCRWVCCPGLLDNTRGGEKRGRRSRRPPRRELPLGAYAHVITHEERRGIACTLFVVYASQIMSFPSCEAMRPRRGQMHSPRGEDEFKTGGNENWTRGDRGIDGFNARRCEENSTWPDGAMEVEGWKRWVRGENFLIA